MVESRVVTTVTDDGEPMQCDHGALLREWQVQTSLPQDSPEHRAAIMSLIEAEEIAKDSAVGEVFELTEYVWYPTVRTSLATGRLEPCVRVVFPVAGGRVLAGTGIGLLESIQKIRWASGREPPWYPPLKAKLIQRGLKGGKRTFKLQYVSG